jgi:hypothetical protein
MGEDGKIDLMQINQERDKAGMPIVDPQTGQPSCSTICRPAPMT